MSVATAPPPYTGAGTADPTKNPSAATAQSVQAISSLDEEAATRALNTVLDSPENQKLIADHIRQLAKDTLATRAAFEKISFLLQDFDALKFTTNEGKQIAPLRPGWDALRVRYNDLLKKSHDDAVTIKVVCEDYVEVVLGAIKDPSMSIADVKIELQSFIERTAEAEDKASANSTSFDSLRFDVIAFRKNIEDTFGSAMADAAGRIPQLEASIAGLRNQIRDQQAYIDRCMCAMKVGCVVAGVGAVLMLFCPLAAFLVVGGVLVAAGSANAVRAKQGEMAASKAALASQEAQLAALRQRQQKLKAIQAQLAASGASFDTIITQLTALTNFWTSIKADCDSVGQYLDRAVNAQTAFSFKTTLSNRLAGSVYIVLGQTLAIYVSQYASLSA